MKVPLKWLKQYVDITLGANALAERLTLAGLNVTAVEKAGLSWSHCVVGRVIDLKAHPNADRLRLVSVDLGTSQIQVVSGAPNLGVGQRVPFAPVGAEILDGHTGGRVRLKPARIKGIVSEGMVCSEKELGISEKHEGIMVLPPDAPVGMPLADYLGDFVLDIDVTPNRPDWLSVMGVGWEVSALTGSPLRMPALDYGEKGKPIAELAAVEILAPDLCLRYCASVVSGIKLGASPSWMQERLISSGMRPINNVVDITNYVMLEFGQPLHAFDFQRLRGGRVVVRRAGVGETIVSLDGVQRPLKEDMLVIADRDLPVAIAGLMGGEGSEVGEGTTAVLLESANFHRTSIRSTSQQLSLRTEASIRFEKGLNPELAYFALRRATQLVLEIAGGQAARGTIDVYPGRREQAAILFPLAEVTRLLGIEIDGKEAEDILCSLGFDCEREDGDTIHVKTPYWRSDISLKADLVEEIARIYGYDRIPLAGLKGSLPPGQEDPVLGLKEKAKSIFIGLGFQEVINYSLTSLERLRKASLEERPTDALPLRVSNPLSTEQEYLRTTLRAGLMSTLAHNERHSSEYIRLFEIGRVYLPGRGELPHEKEMLAAVMSGLCQEPFWEGKKELVDFYDAKGVAEAFLSCLGIRQTAFEPWKDGGLLPGRTARVRVDGRMVGVLGELHPAVAKAFDVSSRAFFLEIDLESLAAPGLPELGYQPLPCYPGAIRDLAVVVDKAIPAERVYSLISGSTLVGKIALFDAYEGKQLSPDKKSFAFRIVFQSPSHTLTEVEVNEAQQSILEKLHQELGATLRA